MVSINTANDSKMIPAITITVTIVLAFTGYIVTYLNSLRLAKRKDNLDFLNRQLADYYGPLYALLLSNQMAFESFIKKYKPDNDFFDSKNKENIAIYRHFMKVIIMPANEKILEVIGSKSDLLIEDKMPQCLKSLIAHIVVYRAVVEKWDSGLVDENFSINDFPDEAAEYVNKSYNHLKKHQTKMLRERKFI